MVVGVLRLTLFLPENHSLKGKRQVLRSIKDRVRNKFNVSIAESDGHDMWQRAELGICQVGNDRPSDRNVKLRPRAKPLCDAPFDHLNASRHRHGHSRHAK